MVVLHALKRTAGLFRRHPVLLPVVAALLLVPNLLSLPRVAGVGSSVETMASLASLLFGPLFFVPALALLDHAADADETAFAPATDRYGGRVASLVGANVVVLLAAVAWGFAFAVLAILLRVLGALLALLVLFLAAPLVQFVDVAVVVSDERAVPAVSRSVRAALDHYGAALGFLVARVLLSLAAAAPFLVTAHALPPALAADGPLQFTPLALAAGAFALCASAFLAGYRVVFYRELVGIDDAASDPASTRDPRVRD